MSTDGGLEDLPLIDLFRAEVETHTEVLNNALLELERTPADTSRVSEMMRAAHSIKGAARVVGVDPAVSVAHHMEDCFVAAQKGNLTLTPADVDVLLRGVDLLGKISEATRDPKLDLANEFESGVKSLVVELEAMVARSGTAGAPTAVSGSSIAPTPVARQAHHAETGPIAPGSAGLPLPGAMTLTFPEVLDGTVAEELRRQLLAAGDQGCATVWFDLRATRDLDVQGLAFLAAVPLHVAKHGRPRVQLTGVSPEMETVLKVTGLSEPYASPGESPEDQ